MSEKFPDNRPVLVPHNNEIQVWSKTDREDIDGNPIVEEFDGGHGRAEKSALPGALSDEVQAGLARILAMDRNPTPEQMERGSDNQIIIEELGEQALSASMAVEGTEHHDEAEVSPVEIPSIVEAEAETLDAAPIDEIEDAASDEAAPESAIEGLETRIKEFSQFLDQTEAGVRSDILNYKSNTDEAIGSLRSNGRDGAAVLDEIQYSLNRVRSGLTDIGSAMNDLPDKINHIRSLVLKDREKLDDINRTSRTGLGRKLGELRDGDLAQKKAAFGDVSSDGGQEALAHASRLDQSLILNLDIIGQIRSAVSGTEEANSIQLSLSSRLLDMAQPYGQMGEADFDQFNRMVIQLKTEFDENNNSRLIRLGNTLEGLSV